jgi:hypothetical protein
VIASLEDAWRWYQGVKALAGDMERLGRRLWDREPLAAELARDDRFRHVESSEIEARARLVRDDLDDLGVLVLFSVFEALVRDRATKDVRRSLSGEALHPAVERAVEGVLVEIESGSFGRVTQAFRGMGPDLIEEVDQVRRYRNWVAHGRRGKPPDFVDPRKTYDRLGRFLDRMAEVAGGPGSDGS